MYAQSIHSQVTHNVVLALLTPSAKNINTMYVEFTFKLVKSIVDRFCKHSSMEPSMRNVEKIFAHFVNSDMKKYYICGATCASNGKICMTEVTSENAKCHMHDPKRKCQGVTNKGHNCGSIAKTGQKYG